LLSYFVRVLTFSHFNLLFEPLQILARDAPLVPCFSFARQIPRVHSFAIHACEIDFPSYLVLYLQGTAVSDTRRELFPEELLDICFIPGLFSTFCPTDHAAQ
jgi:hypothetical protein